MKEIAEAIGALTEAIQLNSVPPVITMLGTFVPIVISLIIIWQSYRQNKKSLLLQRQIENSSQKLQEELSKREEQVQMRNEILKIYDSYCLAQNVIGAAHDRIHIIFSSVISYNSTNEAIQLINDLTSAIISMCQAVNRAKLLLPSSDKDIKDTLEQIYKKCIELKDKVSIYYYSGNAHAACETAWNTISSYGITNYNYPALMNNPTAYNSYLKLCSTESTDIIEHMIVDLLARFEYNRFDKLFEPYLQMRSVERIDSKCTDK